MSDPDATADDEIVSAYLDGEATVDERARVDADPALRARVDELGRIAASVADVPRAPAGLREAHLARARQALAADVDPTDTGSPAGVVDLDAARRRRRGALLGVAAAVLVVLLGIGVVSQLGDDESDDFEVVGSAIDGGAEEGDAATSSVAPPAAEQGTRADEDARAMAPEAAEDAAGGSSLPDLGTFATRAQLSRSITATIDPLLAADALPYGPETGAMAFAAGDPASACVTSLAETDTELGALRYGATATLAGEPVVVALFDTDPATSANGQLRLYVVDTATCAPIERGVQTFDP